MPSVRSAFLIIVALCAACGSVAAADLVANGIFLVAKREMRDPRFQQAVVLITQPPQGGPFGVIINRPLDRPLSEVFPEQDALKGRKDVLYFGGPVARQVLMFLVRGSKPPERAIRVLRDVFITADVNWLNGILKGSYPARGLRVYSGYSGWAPEQLQNEIRRGDWHILPADAETIFDKDSARIWPELIRRVTSHQTRLAPSPRADAAPL